MPARTTTSRSRSAWASCSRACAPHSVGRRRRDEDAIVETPHFTRRPRRQEGHGRLGHRRAPDTDRVGDRRAPRAQPGKARLPAPAAARRLGPAVRRPRRTTSASTSHRSAASSSRTRRDRGTSSPSRGWDTDSSSPLRAPKVSRAARPARLRQRTIGCGPLNVPDERPMVWAAYRNRWGGDCAGTLVERTSVRARA